MLHFLSSCVVENVTVDKQSYIIFFVDKWSYIIFRHCLLTLDCSMWEPSVPPPRCILLLIFLSECSSNLSFSRFNSSNICLTINKYISIFQEHEIVLQSKNGGLFFRENFLLFYLWMYFLFPCGLAASRMPVILMWDHLCLFSSHESFALITLVPLPFHLHPLIISSPACEQFDF